MYTVSTGLTYPIPRHPIPYLRHQHSPLHWPTDLYPSSSSTSASRSTPTVHYSRVGNHPRPSSKFLRRPTLLDGPKLPTSSLLRSPTPTGVLRPDPSPTRPHVSGHRESGDGWSKVDGGFRGPTYDGRRDRRGPPRSSRWNRSCHLVGLPVSKSFPTSSG